MMGSSGIPRFVLLAAVATILSCAAAIPPMEPPVVDLPPATRSPLHIDFQIDSSTKTYEYVSSSVRTPIGPLVVAELEGLARASFQSVMAASPEAEESEPGRLLLNVKLSGKRRSWQDSTRVTFTWKLTDHRGNKLWESTTGAAVAGSGERTEARTQLREALELAISNSHRYFVISKTFAQTAAWAGIYSALAGGDMDRFEAILQSSSVDARNDKGTTALMTVVEHGSGQMLKILLAHGADATMVGPKGKTPLMYAAARGDTLIADLLVRSNADQQAVDDSGDGPLDYAFLGRESDMMAYLIRQGAEAVVSHELAGRWSTNLPDLNVRQATSAYRPAVFEFALSGTTLTGTLSVLGDSAIIEEGVALGNRVRFAVQEPIAGQTLRATYGATVTASRIDFSRHITARFVGTGNQVTTIMSTATFSGQREN